VYWTTTGTIMKVPLTGGAAVIVASGQTNPHHVALGSGRIYWTNDDDGVNHDGEGTSVMSLALAGGVPATVARFDSMSARPTAVTADGVGLYWTTYGGPAYTDGAVFRLQTNGGRAGVTPVSLASGHDGPYGGIAMDGTNVFWTTGSVQFLEGVPNGGRTAETRRNGSVMISKPAATNPDCQARLKADQAAAASAAEHEAERREPLKPALERQNDARELIAQCEAKRNELAPLIAQANAARNRGDVAALQQIVPRIQARTEAWAATTRMLIATGTPTNVVNQHCGLGANP
jgi:hypothetical protein